MVVPVAQVTRLAFLTCIDLLPVIPETDLIMSPAVGSTWSLQPRDGLYATTGNLPSFHLSVNPASKYLILNLARNFNRCIISLTIFSMHTQYHNGDT